VTFARLRLGHQIWALILVITLVAGLFMTTASTQRIREVTDETAHMSASNLVDAAATAALDHVLLGELDRTEHVLRRVMAAEGVEHMELRNKERKTIITLARRLVESPSGAITDQQGLADIAVGFGLEDRFFERFGSATAGRYVEHDGKLMLWMSRPLSDTFDAGEVGLLYNDDTITKRQTDILHDQQLRGLMLLLLIAVLVYLLLNRSLRPISRLAGHMRDSQPDGGTPWEEAHSSREVHEIATAFNGLMVRQQQHLDELNANREMLSATFEGTPNGVLVVDARGKLRMANRAAKRLFRFTQVQLAKTSSIDMERLLPGAGTWLKTDAINSRQTDGPGTKQGVRLAALTADGHPFTAEIHASTIHVGREPEHVILLRDVTKDDEARRQAHLHTQRLNTVLALSNEGIVLFSADRQVVFANPQLHKLLGLDGGGRLAHQSLDNFEQHLVAHSLPARPYQPWSASSDGQVPWTFVLTGEENRTLTCTWRRSDDDADELVMFFNDVTAAETVDRMKSEFLSAAAHELRTPLTSILGFSDLMLQHELSVAEQKELLQTIRDQSGLLVNIINEMLDLTRIESRRGQDFQPQACDVAQVCHTAITHVRPPGDQRQVRVAHDHGEFQVWADQQKLHQVLVNLLSNAFKFSPTGGDITVCTSTSTAPHNGKKMLELSVRDEGIGMAPSDLAHAFERFFRADKSGHIPGTGLGLSLVKQIVDLSGGDIVLNSAPGGGTTVTLWLPLVDHVVPTSVDHRAFNQPVIAQHDQREQQLFE
jgi:PAS domain S-box-containing protein